MDVFVVFTHTQNMLNDSIAERILLLRDELSEIENAYRKALIDRVIGPALTMRVRPFLFIMRTIAEERSLVDDDLFALTNPGAEIRIEPRLGDVFTSSENGPNIKLSCGRCIALSNTGESARGSSTEQWSDLEFVISDKRIPVVSFLRQELEKFR